LSTLADVSTQSVSAAFVRARREDLVLPEFPGVHPDNLEAAYQIQDSAIALTGRAVGGWKVGRIAPQLVSTFGAERIGGPIFVDQIFYAADGEVIAMPVLSGFAAVEAEILLKIGKVPTGDLTIEDVPAYVSEVRLGIEIASSPFPGINDHGPAVTASDFGNNFGLVVGPVIEDWRDMDMLNAPTRLEIDGVVQGEGVLANMLDGPFGSLAFLSNMLRRRGVSLNEGDWISTGAITGVHKTTAGHDVRATFAETYAVECRTSRVTNGANGGGA
jgi:2-keto-4-pentenoate hydratase